MPGPISCPVAGCSTTFRSSKGRTSHYRTIHAGGLNVAVPDAHIPLPPNPFDFNAGFDPFDEPQVEDRTPPASPRPPSPPPPEQGPFKIRHPHLTGTFFFVPLIRFLPPVDLC